MLALLIFGAQVGSFTIHPGVILRHFDPAVAFGAGIDGHEEGQNVKMLSPASTQAMLQSGLKSITSRLRTELAGESWHWNPEGSWSDPLQQQGYWTSSPVPTQPILLSYGYRLPRRGNSMDQADNTGYSRLDDGDDATFWKSNPYLDPHYTHVPYATLPQWVIVKFPAPTVLNHARIHWATPYATHLTIDAWSGGVNVRSGAWENLTPAGITNTSERIQDIDFPATTAAMLRIRLLDSSETAPVAANDPRDAMGFAIRELEVGESLAGSFQDKIVHLPHNTQTAIAVSSTDPWHRAVDLNPNTEQPGFDLLANSGLPTGRPILMPTSALYDTPDNVAAEAAWLLARKVPLRGLEIGEEPDGQACDGACYGQLYAQIAKAIRAVDPRVPLGGPSLQSTNPDIGEFPPQCAKPWLTNFLDTLTQQGRRGDFQFASFEWYPFDDPTGDPEEGLARAEPMLAAGLDQMRKNGMQGIPWYIPEYGWSAYACPVEDELPGALFDLELTLQSLRLGAEATYLYGYEPNQAIEEKPDLWGNMMMFFDGKAGLEPMPTYYTTRLLTSFACTAGKHSLLAVSGDVHGVDAFAIQRPDRRIAVLLINRTGAASALELTGVATAEWQGQCYDPSCFHWNRSGETSHPTFSYPPNPVVVKGGEQIGLPPSPSPSTSPPHSRIERMSAERHP